MLDPAMRIGTYLFKIVGVLAALACGSSASAGYKELDTVDGGVIKGTVKLSKPAPPAKKISVTKDHGTCGVVPDETYVVGKDKGFANVVVFVEKIRKGKKIGKPTATVDNKGCRFAPHVSAFPVGTKLWIVNSDNILHNTHSYVGENKRTLFNIALPMKGVKVPKTIKKEGIIEYKCDAGHTWMHGWSFVTEHPYVTVTDEKGSFELTDVPAGRYKIAAWHEAEGEKSTDGKITVEAAKTTTVEIVY